MIVLRISPEQVEDHRLRVDELYGPILRAVYHVAKATYAATLVDNLIVPVVVQSEVELYQNNFDANARRLPFNQLELYAPCAHLFLSSSQPSSSLAF